MAQKAEAYYKLGFIGESTLIAKDAFITARSIDSKKTMKRIKDLFTTLDQSQYGKENSVMQLGAMLSANP